MASRWRTFRRRFLVAVLLAAALDLVVTFVRLEAINRQLDRANGALTYGLSSVSAWRFGQDALRRLGDRYHLRVWSWNAPFNLTVVCEARRWAEFAEPVARACVTGPWPDSTPPEILRQLPLRRVGAVDEIAYPRRAWLEVPLGLPDATWFATRCAWAGRAACADPPIAPAPSNLIGRASACSRSPAGSSP